MAEQDPIEKQYSEFLTYITDLNKIIRDDYLSWKGIDDKYVQKENNKIPTSIDVQYAITNENKYFELRKKHNNITPKKELGVIDDNAKKNKIKYVSITDNIQKQMDYYNSIMKKDVKLPSFIGIKELWDNIIIYEAQRTLQTVTYFDNDTMNIIYYRKLRLFLYIYYYSLISKYNDLLKDNTEKGIKSILKKFNIDYIRTYFNALVEKVKAKKLSDNFKQYDADINEVIIKI